MSKNKTITPYMFVQRMNVIAATLDTEDAHARADVLMCELLESLGYKEGVAIYKAMDKWYA